MGAEISVVKADNNRAIETAFAILVRTRVEALLIGTDPFFFSRRVQLATLATRHAIPAAFNAREFAEVGGLMSYGTSLTEGFRQLAFMLGASSMAPNPPICPSCARSRLNWSSKCRLPGHSASTCHRRCSPAPTR